MAPYLRLRQICLATDDLPRAEADLSAIFGVQLAHRDPKVAIYGIHNALFPFGLSFIELIAPLQADNAAARFVQRGPSRGAYMAIFNCDDPRRRRLHVQSLGLRVAAEIDLDGFYGIQLHPRDGRATMIELDHTRGEDDLRGPYFAAGGSGWTQAICTDTTQGLRAVVLESPNPQDLGHHWSRILERPLEAAGSALHIDVELCRIHLRNGPLEVLRTVVVEVCDAAAVLRRATELGYTVQDQQVLALCGVNFLLTETSHDH